MSIYLDQNYKISLRQVIRLLVSLTFILISSYFITPLHNLKGLAEYVPFHTFLENVSIMASLMIFGVCWGVQVKERAANFLVLASVFLGVSMIDFLHALSYKGMPVLVSPSGIEKGIFFWLAARILSAIGLLVVSILPWKPLDKEKSRWLILIFVLLLVSIVAWIGLWHLEWIPRTYIEGLGLTKFKVVSEYLIMFLYFLSAFIFYRQLNQVRTYDVVGLFAASCIMGMSEFFFTIYADIADIYNILGHIYKVIAYAYVYKSIFLDSIQKPIRQLNESNAKLEREILDRQKIESRLADNEKLLSTILHTLPVAVFVKDVKKGFQIKIWNKFAEKLFGINAVDLIGKYDYDFFPKEEADWFRVKDLEACQHYDVIEIPEEIAQTKKGTSILHTRKTVVRDSTGEPLYLIGVSEDITEDKKTTDNLRDALNSRDEFLIIASHELKTPITALKLRLQLMQKHFSEDNKITKEIDTIISQVDRLTKLINTILDVSRIQSGVFSLELVPVNILQTVLDIIDQLHVQLEKVDCKVEVKIAPELYGIWDQARIEQIITNLLLNSIKYAPGSMIFISAELQGDKNVIIRYRDTGPGISKEKHALLFTRFERAGAPLSISGLGLGLYICKKIIEALHGTIRIESEEGQGVLFIIELPKSALPAKDSLKDIRLINESKFTGH